MEGPAQWRHGDVRASGVVQPGTCAWKMQLLIQQSTLSALEGPPGHHVRRVPGNRRRHPPPTAAFEAQCRPRAAQSPRSPCALAAFPAACPLSAVFAVCLSVLKLLAFSAIDEGKGLSLL